MYILNRLPGRDHRLAAWLLALSMFTLLGFLRTTTEAEFTFASAAIIPVFLVTWTAGFIHGAIASVLSVTMWVVSDLLSERQFSAAWIPAANGLTRLATYLFVAYMTARVRTLLSHEIELSTRDALTGLLNRRAFFEAGENEVGRARRYRHSLAIVFLDLDNFKRLNDTQGHHAGDLALKAVAGALQRNLRATDRVARLGGDEFAILLPQIDRGAAAEAGNKIANGVAGVLARFAPVSASIGVAWFEGAGESFQAMLNAADSLMYEIKQDGKSDVRLRSFMAVGGAPQQP